MASNNSQIPTTSSPGYPALERVTEEWSSLRYPLSNPSQTTLKSWKSCLFVKLGWFTTAEAVTYVDLFFQNMNTLSPILNNYYHAHSNHHTLVLKDPVLCCTIITLSSRYHLLAGEGGLTRGFQIHYRMWKHCQSLFHRVVWGQRGTTKDQVGALGTIESFLLVTEWHPRSIHLPVDLDSWESEPMGSENDEGFRIGKGLFSRKAFICAFANHLVVPNKWLQEIQEITQRSDRMSWSVYGLFAFLWTDYDIASPALLGC
jgi:hypothetical protein